jgi:hypothetical protein
METQFCAVRCTKYSCDSTASGAGGLEGFFQMIPAEHESV